MGAIGFYIFFGINWIMTLLPLPVLYLFSDFFYLFIYYLPGYRRQIVRNNLKNSFPEKNEKEILIIEKKFYHHLCDLFVETLKLTHMSNKQLMKRIQLTNPELLEKLSDEDRDVVAILAHYGNWEWQVCNPLYSKMNNVSIYKPLQNKYFDHFMINLRSKYGMKFSPMSNIAREVINNRNKNVRTAYAFISDQTPPIGDINFWTNFLNQETPVYLGAEKIATKYDMAVVTFFVQKIKRGYYSYSAELLFDHTVGLPEHVITDTHVKKLEKIIQEKPEYWIWSHRRWKHKREHIYD
ncbi:MAG: lysophospholipid acyltransferase family protein [Bacteroidia bacterium]|nr:lysophospholipid acyltransferase family protein [Bacteroidia bacterium]